MIIINKGTTIVEGDVKELLNSGRMTVKFDVDKPEETLKLINESAWKEKLNSNSFSTFLLYLEKETAQLNKY